ncbi:MAG: S-layer homology domain-containing protein [Bacillota bacterium]|nr:S-layer homology domain-containing protein [Bacillota bacterium]
MKKLLAMFISVIMVLSYTAVAVFAEGEKIETKLTVGSAEGGVGDTVSVPVEIESTAGLMAIVLKVSYDESALTYNAYKSSLDKGTVKLTLVTGGLVTADNSMIGITLSASDKDVDCNGTLIYLRFTAKNGAKAGNHAIKIIQASAENFAGNIADITTVDGYVKVTGESTEVPAGNGNSTVDPGNTGNTQQPDENGGNENSDDETGGSDVVPVTPGNNTGNNTGSNQGNDDNGSSQAVVPSFSDLGGYDWAQSQILELAKNGVIKGTSDNTFSPEHNITRADFIVLTMRLLSISGGGSDNFEDVPANEYYTDAIASAKGLGIAKGANNKFNPFDSITREDLAVLVYRALNDQALLPVIKYNKGAFNSQYSDSAEISDYALTAMQELWAAGIITGSDGGINPKANATRAETAVIIYRISKLIPTL